MSFEVMYADQGLVQNERQIGDGTHGSSNINLTDSERKFMHFIQTTQERGEFIYR